MVRRGKNMSHPTKIDVAALAVKEGYTIDAAGDCCVGDEVIFEKAVFTGSFKKPRYSHSVVVQGCIVLDSYGALKQQHTFTLAVAKNKTLRIKGRDLYCNGVWRKPWNDEDERAAVLADKHKGDGI